jgi:E1A-binding protein p400
VAFEEKEWELDQLEKLKEEQEAEMDEENEPLSYESKWNILVSNEVTHGTAKNSRN